MRKILYASIFFLINPGAYSQSDCTILPGDTVVCYGQKVYLYPTFYDTLNYSWEPNGETGALIEVVVTGNVIYILHVYNDDNSYSCYDSVTLNVFPVPEIELHYSPYQIHIGDTVTFSFENHSEDSIPVTNWIWYINDSVYTNELTPKYIFKNPDLYTIEFIYWTMDNCKHNMLENISVDLSAIGEMILSDFSLYPNPISDHFTITFYLERPVPVRIEVCNGLGQVVAIILDEALTHGEHKVIWNADLLPPGIYFCHFQADRQFSKGKMVVVK